MFSRGVLGLSLGAALSVAAVADNIITEWGGAPGGYNIVGGEAATVTITAPGTYKFQATDPSRPNGLGDINSITVDASCPSGTVTVSVVRDPNEVGGDPNQPGVFALKKINLWAPNVVGNIQTVRSAANVGELGAVWATALAGDMIVGDPNAGGAGIVSNVSVPQLDGVIDCNSMRNLTVTA